MRFYYRSKQRDGYKRGYSVNERPHSAIRFNAQQ
jgi:hypothetical protein